MNIAMRRRGNLKKMTRYAIFINACQIAAAAGMAIYALTDENFHLTGFVERALVGAMALVVTWGAVLDILDAFSARKISLQRQMLEEAYQQLETLNATLRAQRHDFMNHIQVVYSLTEMEDRASALEYMDRVYGDLQRVSRVLRTSVPAVNALIAAKMADCEEKGIAFAVEIDSPWEGLHVPGWEMCRVLGNIIDNAVEALGTSGERRICVRLSEGLREYAFSVENNGRPIPEELRERLFDMGYSTKGAGRGMGLFTVMRIMESYSGEIGLDAECTHTRFVGKLPKPKAIEHTS